MEFKNGYKLLYSVVEDGVLKVKATKGSIEDGVEVTFGGDTFADLVAVAKLVYVKDGDFYVSTTGIPTEADAAATVEAGGEVVLSGVVEEEIEEEPIDEPEEPVDEEVVEPNSPDTPSEEE